MNVQGNQAPVKRQKMLKKFENSSMKITEEQCMSLQTPLGSVMEFARSLNRKFEHTPHCCINVCLELQEKANKDPSFYL
jgi:hypothetical protein